MTDTPDRPGEQPGAGDQQGYGQHPPYPQPGHPGPTQQGGYPQPGGYPQGGWGQQPAWGQQPGSVPPWPVPRPGIVPLAPLSGPDMLTGALRFIRSHWLVTLVPSAVAMLVLTVAQMLLQFRIVGAVTAGENGASADALGTAFLVDLLWTVGLVLLLSLVLYPLVLSMLYGVLVPAVLGRTVPFGQALREGLRRAPSMLGLYVVISLIGIVAVGVGVGLAVVIGIAGDGSGLAILAAVVVGLAAYAAWIWIAVTLLLAPPVLVVEGVGLGAALTRSRALVRGAWWRTLGILLLGAVVVAAFSVLVSIPTSLLGTGTMTSAITASPGEVPSAAAFGTYFVITGIGSWIVGTVSMPLVAGVTGLIYLDRRMRTEGFAQDLAAQAGTPGS